MRTPLCICYTLRQCGRRPRVQNIVQTPEIIFNDPKKHDGATQVIAFIKIDGVCREITGRHLWRQRGATPSRVVGTSKTKNLFYLFLPRKRENGYNGGQGRFRYIIQVVWIWLAVRYFLIVYINTCILYEYTRDVLCAYILLTNVLYIYIHIYIAVNATTRAHMVKIRAHRKTDRISLSWLIPERRYSIAGFAVLGWRPCNFLSRGHPPRRWW